MEDETMRQFMTEVQPALFELLSVIVTAVISMAALKMREKFNIQIEEKYKQDLHDSAMTGARVVVARLGVVGAESDQAINSVLDHMQKSTGDAIKALDPDAGVLTEIAVAKLEVAKNEAKETKP